MTATRDAQGRSSESPVLPLHAAPDPQRSAGPREPSVGTDRRRVDAPLKVTGTAPYAYEHPTTNPCHVWPVLSTIARGTIIGVDASRAAAVPGVIRVLTHADAPRLRVKADAGLWILQGPEVHHRGQIIGGVIADTPEAAREAAELLVFTYDEAPSKVELDPDGPDVTTAKVVLMRPGSETKGDPEQGWGEGVHRVDATYEHTAQYHAQMEPHAVIATWHEVSPLDVRATRLTLQDSNQGPLPHRLLLAPLLGLLPHQLDVSSPYVGGAFGGKAFPHPHLVLASLAAKIVSPRPVKLALTRQQMFSVVGHRAASSQHVRLAADAEGRLTMVEHVSTQAASRVKNSVDHSCMSTRMMYATPNRHTEHRVLELDVPPSTWMRAPGDFTGMFALETALDELAHTAGIDPVDLRVRNEPDVDPENGKPWSTRALVACLQRGAERFGWDERQAPGQRRDGEWQIGLGMASAVFPNMHMVTFAAKILFTGGRYVVQLQASDIGTGAHTVLAQIAADALGVDPDLVVTDIGRTGTPMAMVAGGSSGTYEWGNSVVAACEAFRRKHGLHPAEGASATGRSGPPKGSNKYSRNAFGAHFAEVAVSSVTDEVRVRRLLGVYAAGTIINPRTARSQVMGGMIMALSGALLEESYRDPRFGHIANGDLASYHVAAHADVPPIDVEFLPEHDPWFGAKGSKGIGEIGMVGTPAALGNAVFNATGKRLRSLPFTPSALAEA
ncbi:xanthine dehydrogenase family protein molybdopterin-binding subunit [Propioniciclava soli]|uniref:xanthine dehydrogenase family protein molybdopterin-binding subunit n=1 Tax=Propioniciclava soli TaxID=2775081 RepID=UPI001E2F150F|nr:xanthine dehydrogenase family protein molybdopterin-binding subunit [Propioniciclava soli]